MADWKSEHTVLALFYILPLNVKTKSEQNKCHICCNSVSRLSLSLLCL